ncbi:MAG: 3'-5' exonuclease [Candidatus Algichlamydia australiensis]|nr:3'-5' exonuclease [Chlamydiales bacterium]
MKGIFLDTETNGLNFRQHRLIELAYKIVDLNSGECLSQFSSLRKITHDEWKQSDPESLDVNGFTWEDVTHGISADEIAKEVILDFKAQGIKRGSSVFICQNPSFDRVFFSSIIDVDVQEQNGWPYHWLDMASMFWALQLQKGEHLPWKTGFTKDKIAKFLGLGSEEHPHRAMNGVDHLLEIYRVAVGFPECTK